MGLILRPDQIGELELISTTVVRLNVHSSGQSWITVGGQQYLLDQQLNVDTSASGIGGIDTGSVTANSIYFIYLVRSGSSFGLVASLDRTAPTGFDWSQRLDRVVYVFHDSTIQSFRWAKDFDEGAMLAEYAYTNSVAGGTITKQSCDWLASINHVYNGSMVFKTGFWLKEPEVFMSPANLSGSNVFSIEVSAPSLTGCSFNSERIQAGGSVFAVVDSFHIQVVGIKS